MNVLFQNIPDRRVAAGMVYFLRRKTNIPLLSMCRLIRSWSTSEFGNLTRNFTSITRSSGTMSSCLIFIFTSSNWLSELFRLRMYSVAFNTPDTLLKIENTHSWYPFCLESSLDWITGSVLCKSTATKLEVLLRNIFKNQTRDASAIFRTEFGRSVIINRRFFFKMHEQRELKLEREFVCFVCDAFTIIQKAILVRSINSHAYDISGLTSAHHVEKCINHSHIVLTKRREK